jgi:ATP/ADP translocase
MQMQNTFSSFTRPLAFAGALPFVASALLLWAGHASVPVLGSVANIASSYGLLILAFMAGVHWGQRLSGVETELNLFLISNAIALAGWFAYLLLLPQLFFASLAVLFAVVLMVDKRLAAEGHLLPDYICTRTAVSALVVMSLAVIALKV